MSCDKTAPVGVDFEQKSLLLVVPYQEVIDYRLKASVTQVVLPGEFTVGRR